MFASKIYSDIFKMMNEKEGKKMDFNKKYKEIRKIIDQMNQNLMEKKRQFVSEYQEYKKDIYNTNKKLKTKGE